MGMSAEGEEDNQRDHESCSDCADMQTYGMPIRETNEAACVAWLTRLYEEKEGERPLEVTIIIVWFICLFPFVIGMLMEMR